MLAVRQRTVRRGESLLAKWQHIRHALPQACERTRTLLYAPLRNGCIKEHRPNVPAGFIKRYGFDPDVSWYRTIGYPL